MQLRVLNDLYKAFARFLQNRIYCCLSSSNFFFCFVNLFTDVILFFAKQGQKYGER